MAVDDGHRSLRRALADELELARLQVRVLEQLHEADARGDDGAVQRCHAELGHVMAKVAEIEQVRTGATAAESTPDEVACAGCGALAEPVYETPRLLRYSCAACGWTAHDPAAQAARQHARAKDSAVDAVHSAAPAIAVVLVRLRKRWGKDRDQGMQALKDVRQDLESAAARVRKSEQEAHRAGA